MRVILCIVLIGLTVGAAIPTAQADETVTTASSTSTTASDAGSSGTGPDPSTCRPYCLAA